MAEYGSLPFDEQITYFREKVSVPTAAWTDIYAAEQDQAFMVAGARGQVLEDLRGAVDRAIENGTTLADFRAEFRDIVARNGWAYNGGLNWRTNIIYSTNMRQSYNAGRELQMADPALRKARPYGLYRHGGSAEPRINHLSWNGTVLPLDDPWWQTHSPQNGWGCSCKKFMVSAADVKRLGLKVADQAPPIDWQEKTVGTRGPSPRTVRVPAGIDPGFEYAPGRSRLEGNTPRPLPGGGLPPSASGDRGAVSPLTPRATDAAMLPAGLGASNYTAAFLQRFGLAAEEHQVFYDAAGEPLLIAAGMFAEPGSDPDPGAQGPALALLADAIADPDEIWLDWVMLNGVPLLRRRYVAARTLDGGDATLVFDIGRGGWAAEVATGDQALQLGERSRRGLLLWGRE